MVGRFFVCPQRCASPHLLAPCQVLVPALLQSPYTGNPLLLVGGGGGGIVPHDRPSHTSAEVWGFYLTAPSQGVGALPAPPPQARSWGAAGWGCNRMGVQTPPHAPQPLATHHGYCDTAVLS